MKIRLRLVFSISVCFFTVFSIELGAQSGERPNIVYMMADDLGIGDVKCYGGDRCRTRTPAMDSLARDGMKFTDAHVTASVCVPSRMAIMTGRYAWRFKAPEMNGPWGFLNPRFKTDQFTLGRMLKSAGYHTGYVGKWHLGTLMQTNDGLNQGLENVNYDLPLKIGPNDFGFDHTFILPGSLDMYPYAFARNGHFIGNVTARKGWSAFNRVGPAEENFEDYEVLGTFAHEAEDFITKRAESAKNGEPFFLYVALTAPHTPTSPSPKFEGRSKLGLYGDFVEETDATMGRVLAALKKNGLDDNTLVFATSDHGAADYAGNIRKATLGQIHDLEKKGHYASSIYRGYKFTVFEGGLRVPLLIRWPGMVEPGSECDRLVGLNDLMATLADVTATNLKSDQGSDSISFLSLLKNPDSAATRETLVMQSPRAFVVRHKNYKLALTPSNGGSHASGTNLVPEEAWGEALKAHGKKPKTADLRKAPFVQVYDLGNDIGERDNLAARRPEIAQDLSRLLDAEIAKHANDVAKVAVHKNADAWVQ